MYQRFISGRTKVIGSVKSNAFKINHKKKSLIYFIFQLGETEILDVILKALVGKNIIVRDNLKFKRLFF